MPAEYGKSGRRRHYHAAPAPQPSREDRLALFHSKVQRARDVAEERARPAREAEERRRRQEAEERETKRKRDAYNASWSGKIHNFKDRAIGGLGEVFGKIKRGARSAYETAKNIGRGAYGVGKDLVKVGQGIGSGIGTTYRGTKRVVQGTRHATNLGRAAYGMLQGEKGAKEKAWKSIEGLGEAGAPLLEAKKGLKRVGEHMGQKLVDKGYGPSIKRGLEGLGNMSYLPEKGYNAVRNWWRGGKK